MDDFVYAFQTDRENRQVGIEGDLCFLPLKSIADDENEWLNSPKLPIIKRSNNININFQLPIDNKEFADRFYNNYPFLKDIDMSNILFAGGSIQKYITNDINNYIPATSTDIDVFFYGLTERQAIAKIYQINSILIKYLMERNRIDGNIAEQKIKYVNHNNFFSIYFPFRTMSGTSIIEIQFIYRLYSSISEILHGFDIGSSAVGFDGQIVYFTTLSKFAYEYKCNIIDTTRRSTTYEQRLSKYVARGFNIIMPQLNVDAVNRIYNYRVNNPTNHRRRYYGYDRNFERTIIGQNFYLIIESITNNTIVGRFDKRYYYQNDVNNVNNGQDDNAPENNANNEDNNNNANNEDNNNNNENNEDNNQQRDLIGRYDRSDYGGNESIRYSIQRNINYGNYGRWRNNQNDMIQNSNVKYFMRGQYDKMICISDNINTAINYQFDENEFMNLVRNYMKTERMCIELMNNTHLKNALSGYIQDIDILCDKVVNYCRMNLSRKIVFITKNPGTQLTSSINPIYENEISWYGKQLFVSPTKLKENLLKNIKDVNLIDDLITLFSKDTKIITYSNRFSNNYSSQMLPPSMPEVRQFQNQPLNILSMSQLTGGDSILVRNLYNPQSSSNNPSSNNSSSNNPSSNRFYSTAQFLGPQGPSEIIDDLYDMRDIQRLYNFQPSPQPSGYLNNGNLSGSSNTLPPLPIQTLPSNSGGINITRSPFEELYPSIALSNSGFSSEKLEEVD